MVLYFQGLVISQVALTHGLSPVSPMPLSRFDEFHGSFPHRTLKVLSGPMAYLKFPSLYSQGVIKPDGLSQVSITVLSRFDKSHGSFPHGALTVS